MESIAYIGAWLLIFSIVIYWIAKDIKNIVKSKTMVDIEYVKKNCKEGWKLNPNEKVVNGIIKGINRCGGECPCANDAEDKHCPCSNYREHDKCCCTLYVKE